MAKVRLLGVLLLTVFGTAFADEPPRIKDERPEIFWRPVARETSFRLWRSRIALIPGRSDSPVAIGGGLTEAQAEGALLFRPSGGELAPLSLPQRAERSFVLDFDRHGALWLAPFRLGERETYEGLRVFRFRDGTFEGSLVRPGIWPQAIDVLDENDGYIAGNHGRFLRLEQGRWQPEELPGGPGRWQDHNFLAVKLLSGGDGWAVGKPGLVARRRNGRFQTVAVPDALSGTELTDLDVDETGRLYITTYSGEIARLDGERWRVDKVAESPLMGIDLVGEHDGWAVGVQGTLLRFDGRRWQKQALPGEAAVADLHHIAMSSPTQGFLAGANSLFEATPVAPLFVEAGRSSRFPMVGQVGRQAIAADLDLDGDVDLVISNGREARLYENTGQSFATGKALPFVTPQGRGDLTALAVGETNGDGRPDLLATFNPPGLSLLVQKGELDFEDATAAAGLLGIDSGNDGAAEFVDFDRDGDLDLYLSRHLGPRGARYADLAFANVGRGRFSVLDYRGGARGIERLALWGDLGGGRHPDLVLPDNGHLFSSLLLDPLASEPIHDLGLAALPPGQYNQGNLADLGNDGFLDLVLFAGDGFLLRGLGGGRLAVPEKPFHGPPSESLQPARLAAVADLDLDGRPEVLVTRHHDGTSVLRVYRADTGGLYRDVAREWGLADLRGDAALPFDFDRDGDLDLLLVHLDGNRLLINQLQNGPGRQGYLAVELRGIPSNPSAIGAEVRLHSARGELRRLEVSALGDGPGGRRPAGHLLFPVAAAEGPWRVVVDFPSGDRQEESGLQGGHLVVWEQGARQAALARSAWVGTVNGWAVILGALVLIGAGLFVAWWRRRAGRRESVFVTGSAELPVTIGPYRCYERIGSGGTGEVFRAQSPGGDWVAVKLLHVHLARDRETRLRFERESELLRELEVSGLVRGLGRGEHGGIPYLVTELLEGCTLRQWLDRHGAQPNLALGILAGVAEIVAALHDLELIHRDLKSDNVFVLTSPAGENAVDWRRRVRLLDLGLVAGGRLATLTRTGQGVGTLAYMAPEQLRGEKAGRAADLWALGLLLAEVYTGERPTLSADGELGGVLTSPGQAPSRERLRELFPLAWARLVEGLLAGDPAQRFAEVDAVMREVVGLRSREAGEKALE